MLTCNISAGRTLNLFLILLQKHGEALLSHNARSEILVLDDIISKSSEIGLSAEGTEYALQYLKSNQQVDTATMWVFISFSNFSHLGLTLFQIAMKNTNCKLSSKLK